jgi:hypothetical protein
MAMPRARTPFQRFLSTILPMCLIVCGAQLTGSAQGQKTQHETMMFHSPLPLGADGYLLRPLNRRFYLMASADNPEFDKIKVTRIHLGGTVVGPDGTEMRHYPQELTFRVTASAIESDIFASDVDPVNYSGDLNSFLLGLKFRLKVHRGLKVSVIQPERVHLIGVPADLPFEERVYHVAFDAGDVPLDARLVLEVTGPDGEKLSRFHLEML